MEIDAFITYSPAEETWAARLDADLRRSGVSTWFGADHHGSAAALREQIEKGIADAKNIVVLIGAESAATDRQRFEWMTALEAVWRDSSKRLIAFLLGDAALPGFVRSAVHWSRGTAAIRVDDPSRDWDQAVSGLIKILKSGADLRTTGKVLDTLQEDRRLQRERLSYIRRVAAEFE
jgi:hypothetical protein